MRFPADPTIRAVDLFCGAGGLTRGLLDAGVDVVAGIDFNEDCRYAYCHNNGVAFVGESVADTSGEEIASTFDDAPIRLLCGCAPCQTFSTMNQSDEQRRRRDRRWKLLKEFDRLVREVKPELVTMENVPGLEDKDVFVAFVHTLDSLGYCIDYAVVDCADYGLPQRRRRLVLLASRLGTISVPSAREWGASPQTLRDAIGWLPALTAGSSDDHDRLHVASRLSEKNIERIRASVPGGTWHDWRVDLRLPCHGRKKGDGYTAVYGRMEWDKPSPTITTQFNNYGSGRFGHPDQDRALSLREGALLQGFPRDYEFEDPAKPMGKKDIAMLIGNAVPVGLGRIVGRTLVNHVGTLNAGGSNRKRSASLS